jgi:hypothetical protein
MTLAYHPLVQRDVSRIVRHYDNDFTAVKVMSSGLS